MAGDASISNMLFRWVYSLLLYLFLPFLLLRMLWRRDPRYRQHLLERLGLGFRELPVGAIWVHAVSAGEVNAAARLISGLVEDKPVLLTMSTPSGRERAEQIRRDTGCSLHYLPFDCPDMVARSLSRIRPSVLVLVDTELWPNWIRGCSLRDIPVALINGRMNARSARGYALVSPLSRPMLASVSLVAAQSEAEGQLLVDLGVRPECLQVTGNVKFDVRPAPPLDEAVTRCFADRCNWVAGSTHPGEEALLITAWERQPSELRPRLVLAPRHVERSEELMRLVRDKGHQVAGFSRLNRLEPAPETVIVDELGHLASLYQIADIAFIGGSLVSVGGHNMIEAAVQGKAMLMGPEVYKVVELANLFQAAGALRLVTGEQLQDSLQELLQSASLREEMGRRGRQLVSLHKGATDRSLILLRRLLTRRL